MAYTLNFIFSTDPSSTFANMITLFWKTTYIKKTRKKDVAY